MNLMFHQLNASPHVAPLAEALAKQGHRVVFAAYGEVSDDRAKLGWRDYIPEGCEYHRFSDKSDILNFLRREAANFEHVCQGFRANGLVSFVQDYCKHNQIGFFVTSEVVNDIGFLGVAKRLAYRRKIRYLGIACKGVLAIGARAPSFFERVGVPSEKIYDFAYFVRDFQDHIVEEEQSSQRFRILFVGQLIYRKGVDILIKALNGLNVDYELDIVGSGRSEKALLDLLKRNEMECVRFHGSVSIENVSSYIQNADCLVLPSRFDGWGAVISESISRGTSVICSDSCGVSAAVRNFPGCFVFTSDDTVDLRGKLFVASSLERTKEQRYILASLGRSLTATAGASYLVKIIESNNRKLVRPIVPWLIDSSIDKNS